MAAIFEPVTIGWDGKEYTITPTMALLNRVEQRVSIAAMAHHMSIGEPRMSHIATAVSILLQSAGVNVTDAQVYQSLMHADQASAMDMCNAIVAAAFPARKGGNQGNEKAPTKTAKRQK